MDKYIDFLILENQTLASVLDRFVIDESVKEKKIEIAEYLNSKGYSKEDIPELVSQIIDIDPTTRSGKHEYIDQILKWIENGKVILPEDYETAKNATRNFFKMKKKMPLLKDKSIEDFNSPGEIQKMIDSGKQKTKRQNRTESFTHLGSKGEYSFYKVEEEHKEAFCKLAQKTEWCVKDPDYFSRYGAPYYYLSKDGRPHGLIHIESKQFKDAYDETFPAKEGVALRGWLRSMIPENLIDVEEDPEELLCLYSSEEVLSQGDFWALTLYAQDVLGERWPEAEKILAPPEKGADIWEHYDSNPFDAICVYAKEVVGDRWPEGEAAILENYKNWDISEAAEAVRVYANEVIRGRWPEGEEILLQSPPDAVLYARIILKGRWPEAEEVISKDPTSAFQYLQLFIGGRWSEAEEAISQNASIAYKYAVEVMQEKWPENSTAEKMLKKNIYFWGEYQRHFEMNKDSGAVSWS